MKPEDAVMFFIGFLLLVVVMLAVIG